MFISGSFTKVVKSTSFLAISSLFLSSSLVSTTWAMDDEKTETSHSAPSQRRTPFSSTTEASDLDNPYYQERPTWRNLGETCQDDLNKHWLDIKGARCYLNPYSKDTGLEEAIHTKLELAIKAYHNIEKKDERIFESRIHALKYIAKLSAEATKDLSIDNPNRIPLSSRVVWGDITSEPSQTRKLLGF